MCSITVLEFTLSFFFFFFFFSQTAGLQESRPLKQPSKSEIFKTIHTKYGDIFDCVDIHKQPSLAHPLLQNHKLQMKPSFIPEASPSQKNKKYVQLELEDGGCPEGSVPIKRITEEDHIRLQTHLQKYPSAINPNNEENSGWHAASIYTKKMGPIRGARGLINIYNPSVTKEQHSDSLVYVQSGAAATFNAIQAGWTVFPAVYGDSIVRLHTMWTADNYKKTGCIDLHCAGFVQVSKSAAPGITVHPVSQFYGQQYVLPIDIYQDPFSGHWWLVATGNMTLGYWPKDLFTGLSQFGDQAGWGGRAHGPEGMAPPMGSGYKPNEGFRKSCFVEEIQYAGDQEIYVDVHTYMLSNRVDQTNHCYGVKLFSTGKHVSNIFFGGPGGRCL